MRTMQEDEVIEDDNALRMKHLDMIDALGRELSQQIKDRIAEKAMVEERWLEDLRMYNAEYSPEELRVMAANKRSSAFVSALRQKCNVAEAHLAELILPTENRNWGCESSPVPAQVGAKSAPDEQTKKDAHNRAALMQDEMDDQLTIGQFNQHLRDIIHDTVVLGTGVLKGPVTLGRTQRSWAEQMVLTEDGPAKVYGQVSKTDYRPFPERVDPWDFFPSTDARRVEESEGVFQRHRKTKSQLRELAKSGEYIVENIKRLLELKPDGLLDGLAKNVHDERDERSANSLYQVWEYNGPIELSVLKACLCEQGQYEGGVEDDDILEAPFATVFFCQGVVIRAVIDDISEGRPQYYTFNWERNDNSVWGYGVCRRGNHAQRAANSAWRMVLDNAALASLPQIIVDKTAADPVNGDYTLSPGKLWLRNQSFGGDGRVVTLEAVDCRIDQLMAIFQRSLQLIDEETGISMLQSGQQGPAVTKTALGMSMLLTAANAQLRRLMKQFDDEVIIPFIKRLYNWNMRYNPREDIKGDFEIVAYGSTALMLREQETQALLQAYQLIQNDPDAADMIDKPQLLRELFNRMSVTRVVLSNEEAEQNAKKRQENAGPPPELIRAQAELLKAQTSEKAAAADAQYKQIIGQVAVMQAQIQQVKLQADGESHARELELELTKLEMKAAELSSDREKWTANLMALDKRFDDQIASQERIQAAKISSGNQQFNAELAVALQNPKDRLG